MSLESLDLPRLTAVEISAFHRGLRNLTLKAPGGHLRVWINRVIHRQRCFSSVISDEILPLSVGGDEILPFWETSY